MTRFAGRNGQMPRKRSRSPFGTGRSTRITSTAASAGVNIITEMSTPASGWFRPSPSQSGRATSQARPQASTTNAIVAVSGIRFRVLS